jgi:hypothetical protein
MRRQAQSLFSTPRLAALPPQNEVVSGPSLGLEGARLPPCRPTYTETAADGGGPPSGVTLKHRGSHSFWPKGAYSVTSHPVVQVAPPR